MHIHPGFDVQFGAPHTIRFSDALNTGLLGYPLYCYERGPRAEAFGLYDDAKALFERALGDRGTPAEGKAVTEILDILLDRAEATPADRRIVCAIPTPDGAALVDVAAEAARFAPDAVVTPEQGSPVDLLLDLAEALRTGAVAEVTYEKPGHSLKESDAGAINLLGGRPVVVVKTDEGLAIEDASDLKAGILGSVTEDVILTQRRRVKPTQILAAKRKGLPGYLWPITINAIDMEKGEGRAFLLSRISRVEVEVVELPF